MYSPIATHTTAARVVAQSARFAVALIVFAAGTGARRA
jgi:hypothetical protein